MARSDEVASYTPAPAGFGGARFWALAAIVIAALFAAYWLFLRSEYVPILSELEPKDTAGIAKVLDAKKLDYRIGQDGRSIEVESTQADKARIELAGSELPMLGQIGFELFNQSDMGLTEFAQRINYQRALQGELARTILLIDGIQTVRVHLGLPERSMFRGDRAPSKASVALVLRPGRSLSEATVSGIQRLVAGSIPEMAPGDVAVLDGRGRVVSQISVAPDSPEAGSDAVIQNLQKRLDDGLRRGFPTARFGLNVSLRHRSLVQAAPMPDSFTPRPVEAATLEPRGTPDYSIAIRVTSEQAFDAGMRNEIQRIATSEIGFDAARGDSLAFLVGPLASPDQVVAPLGNGDAIVARSEVPAAEGGGLELPAWWPLASLGGIAVVVILVWLLLARRRTNRRDELASFAQTLRLRLEQESGA